MEAAAEMGGVDEGLELAQTGRLWVAIVSEEPVASGFGEPGTLAAEFRGMTSERYCGFGDGGEINVSGDIGLAGHLQRILARLMVGKGAEGAGAAGWVIIVRTGEAVVNPEHSPGFETVDQWLEERAVAAADFRAVAFRKLLTQGGESVFQERIGNFPGFPLETAALGDADSAFQPSGIPPLDDVAGQSVEQFVAKS